jgi:hypothetical protein
VIAIPRARGLRIIATVPPIIATVPPITATVPPIIATVPTTRYWYRRYLPYLSSFHRYWYHVGTYIDVVSDPCPYLVATFLSDADPDPNSACQMPLIRIGR